MADLVIAVSMGSHGDKEAIDKYMAALKIDTLDSALDDEVDYEAVEASKKELMMDFASGWTRIGSEND